MYPHSENTETLLVLTGGTLQGGIPGDATVTISDWWNVNPLATWADQGEGLQGVSPNVHNDGDVLQ